jgi:hypothetical protein
MANVITTYTRDRGAAKANIRYITRRPGKDNEKITRTLFGLDGVMSKEEAFRMIEDEKRAVIFIGLSSVLTRKGRTQSGIYACEN